ncbi:MAG: DUF4167 domain-containing protein [Pseudomonadota bacterium]
MRSSSKRSRSKSRNNRSNPGNVVNRVFDSSGPEGKVRGTPQQIIDKYQTLARDAQLSGDRVATENFLQHAEHYVRMLGDAQREIDARREQQEQRQQNHQGSDKARHDKNQSAEHPGQKDQGHPGNAPAGSGDQPDVGGDAFGAADGAGDSNLVDTPESKSDAPPAARKSSTRSRKPKSDAKPDAAADDGAGTPSEPVKAVE